VPTAAFPAFAATSNARYAAANAGFAANVVVTTLVRSRVFACILRPNRPNVPAWHYGSSLQIPTFRVFAVASAASYLYLSSGDSSSMSTLESPSDNDKTATFPL